ncbi:hypothetical protein DL240_02055 [Lujinxingia litoralis]|uniref:Uncharacterized protein n=1 Tax=Lujinxingia litoralis TaxID=2211119 RepID=A0A328CDI2_9DELT|nr:hypothetical protein [Lujinxingia litoralis]RAL25019.1 hypothetical protein DL240_02055 [Lujinxingia litoralis]
MSLRGRFNRLVVILVLSLSIGCAHSRSIKGGDEHFAQGDYVSALRAYRDAQVARPGSQEAAQRAFEAERALSRDTLSRLEAARRGEVDVYNVISQIDTVLGLLKGGEFRREVAARYGDVMVEVGLSRAGREGFRQGLDVLDAAQRVALEHARAFPELRDSIGDTIAELEGQWAVVLEERAQAAQQQGRPGSAALYGAVARSLVASGDLVGVPEELASEVRRAYGWTLEVVEPSLVNAVGLRASLPARASLAAVDFGGEEGFELAGEFLLLGGPAELQRWEEVEERSQEYQSGTRMVENPVHSGQRSALISREQDVLELERDIAKEELRLQEYRREFRRRTRDGESTTFVESDIERSERRLSRYHQSLIDARYSMERQFLELEKVPPYVEEPVYSEHFYEVVGQWASLEGAFDARVQVVGADVDEQKGIAFAKSSVSYRHAAQPVLGLARRAESLPSEAALREAFAEEVLRESVGLVADSFETYRERWLVPGDGGESERVEALATYVLLSPQSVAPQAARELEELTGIARPQDVLLSLVDQTK